jgi:hypothetical protein
MKISGNIVDSNNQPLQLANVTIITGDLANKMGTIANDKGDFVLENDIIEPDSQFKISYQGFNPQFFKASELQDKKIKMEEGLVSLEDIVITKNKPTSNKTKTTNTTKDNLDNNLNKHKIIYASLAGILGLALVITYLKKNKWK